MLIQLEELKRLLLNDWDPIGIADVPEAVGEYDSHALHMLTLLNEGADAPAIADYLSRVATVHMGVAGNPDRDRRIAERAIVIVRARDLYSLRRSTA